MSTVRREAHGELARAAWLLLRDLVIDHDRRRDIADTLGISFARVRALKHISDGPLTLRELARELQTDPPYATRIVDDLEQGGLVERSADPQDRRVKRVSLTAEGTALADRAALLLDLPPARLQELSEEDLGALVRILSQLER